MILKELIQRAVELAIKDIPAADRSALEIAAEAVVPVVFGDVGRELAQSDKTRHLLRRTKDVTVANGSVVLSDDVLTEYACEASLYDPVDVTKRYSYADWTDLLGGQLDDRLGHFLFDRNVLTVVEPDSQYDPALGPTVNLKLTIPCTPDVPALNSTVDVQGEIIDLLVQRTAKALRPLLTK